MDQQTHPPLEHVDGGVHTSMKAKDGLSSGSGGSVVDEDSPQLIDSGDSYFPDDYPSCMRPVDGVRSEEEVGSDDSRSYFSDVFTAPEQPQQVQDEPLGWWVWY